MQESEILERLEKATYPDCRLDAEIIASLNNAIVKPYPPTDDYGPRNKWQFWSLDGNHFLGSEHTFDVPPLTASLDAATKLVERQGFLWLRKSQEAMTVYRPLTPEQDARKEWAVHHSASGATPALALLIALFRSRSKEELG